MSRVTIKVRNTSGKAVYASGLFYTLTSPSTDPLTVCSVGATGNSDCSKTIVWPPVLDGGKWFELIADVPTTATGYIISLHTSPDITLEPVKTLQGSIKSNSVSNTVEVFSSDSSGWAIGLAVLWAAWLVITLLVLILVGVRLARQSKCNGTICPL